MRKTGLIWLWVAVLTLLLDRVTKWWAATHLVIYTPVAVVPGFNLTLAYNKGAAFSFLDNAAGWQGWVFGVIAVTVSLIIVIWLARTSARERWLSIALSMIVGGAIGNLWDRLSAGHVTDFIQLYVSHYAWPTFNVADSAICVGAFMLFIHIFFQKKLSE